MTQTSDQVEELEGTVVDVDPDLVFTTPPKPHLPKTTEAERMHRWILDGEVYHLVKPRKWEDLLVELESINARRATQADRINTGMDFLQAVIVPESMARLRARARDDQDDFEILDLFDLLPQIIRTLAKKDSDGGAAAKTKTPARARARAAAAQ